MEGTQMTRAIYYRGLEITAEVTHGLYGDSDLFDGTREVIDVEITKVTSWDNDITELFNDEAIAEFERAFIERETI